jgi:hypothetical protein
MDGKELSFEVLTGVKLTWLGYRAMLQAVTGVLGNVLLPLS